MTPTGPGNMYDRMKRTGYLMGSKHPMSQTVPAAPGEAGTLSGAVEKPPEGATTPPNYRDAGNEPGSCGECLHFRAGNCEQFSTPVEANMLCDAFEQRELPQEAPPEGIEEGSFRPMPAPATTTTLPAGALAAGRRKGGGY